MFVFSNSSDQQHLFGFCSNVRLFQWRIEKDKNVETEGKPILEYNAGVPVSKISCIVKGLGNEILRKAAKKQRGRMSTNVSLLFFIVYILIFQCRMIYASQYKAPPPKIFLTALILVSSVKQRRYVIALFLLPTQHF